MALRRKIKERSLHFVKSPCKLTHCSESAEEHRRCRRSHAFGAPYTNPGPRRPRNRQTRAH